MRWDVGESKQVDSTAVLPLVANDGKICGGYCPPVQRLRFIDLFAGLGGFHLALDRLGHECVFASELDPQLRQLYETNFGIKALGNIKAIEAIDIPKHDILCAGFPCQPFSKAGEQNGLDDPKWGDLFSHILRIVKYHHPRYLLLENVPNFARHNNGETWRTIKKSLEDEGYAILEEKLSPHRHGIPQVRERVFIVGSRTGLDGFTWPTATFAPTSITTVLDKNPPEAKRLSSQVVSCIEIWQDFLNRFPKEAPLPSFPIWSMEFGATYPYENRAPLALGIDALRGFRGTHGLSFKDLSIEEVIAALPAYARTKDQGFPSWKVKFIKQNRKLYVDNQSWIDAWLPKLRSFPASLQKFEWNCKGEERDIWKYVLQFRASGVRVKRPTTAPSLVAMTTTQVPIIAWERRYMTPRECARLQSMSTLTRLPDSPTAAYKALGNAVNVELVGMIAELLVGGLRTGRKNWTAGEIGSPQASLRV